MARVKQRMDMIVLSSRWSFHSDGGMVQVVVVICLAWLNDDMMYIAQQSAISIFKAAAKQLFPCILISK